MIRRRPIDAKNENPFAAGAEICNENENNFIRKRFASKRGVNVSVVDWAHGCLYEQRMKFFLIKRWFLNYRHQLRPVAC